MNGKEKVDGKMTDVVENVSEFNTGLTMPKETQKRIYDLDEQLKDRGYKLNIVEDGSLKDFIDKKERAIKSFDVLLEEPHYKISTIERNILIS